MYDNEINTWWNGQSCQPQTQDVAGPWCFDFDLSLYEDPSSPPSPAETYTWDIREKLESVTEQGAGTANYHYDSFGAREKVDDPSGDTTAYLYDGATPVQVVTTAGRNVSTTNIVSLPGSNEILTINGIVPIHDALGTVLGGVDPSTGKFAYCQ